MSEVNRYHEFKNGVVANEHGMFVKHEDYAKLKAQRDALAADREKFAVQCAAAKIAVQYAQAAGFECTLNTPAVDAYLNSVRAEGVEMFGNSNSCADEFCFAVNDFADKLRAGEPS